MPLPLLAIGAGISAFGSLMGGAASSKAYSQAAIAARVAAVRRRLKADDDARMIEEQGNRFQANQAVGFAKSGVLIDQGSPLKTLMDTATHVERNALKVRLSGGWDAEGMDSQASAYDAMASGAAISSLFKATGSFVTAAGLQQGAYKPSGGGMSQGDFLKLTSDFGA